GASEHAFSCSFHTVNRLEINLWPGQTLRDLPRP
ncbi:hypothetical protein A2U01_0117611, partial [Trifolium medium]|nr:hypothetical protein [Trifolium medium]